MSKKKECFLEQLESGFCSVEVLWEPESRATRGDQLKIL